MQSRTASGGLLQDAERSLSEAVTLLLAEPPTTGVRTALDRLEQVRRNLAVLSADAAQAVPAARSAAEPALVRRRELPVAAASSRVARAFAKQTLARWAVPTPVVSSVVDVVSELVTNAVRHSSRPVVLLLELSAGELRVGVWDDSPERPRLLPYRPGVTERGIGLRLVKQLSAAWGHEDDAEGKWVWARIAVPAPRTP